MATTIEKFVFESKNPLAALLWGVTSQTENEGESKVPAGLVGGMVQDFMLPADARVVHVKVNNRGCPAFYAVVDDSLPTVARRMAAFPSRTPLPPNFVYVGTSCDGCVTFHIGEVIVTD